MSYRASIFASAAVLLMIATAPTTARQRGPAPDPLVRENATVKVAPHTYVIPDGNVGLVPNVGIVVGSRATLVIDPGLGRRNGETVLKEVAKVSRNTTLYIATTHFHPEHTTGYAAFPATAKYINSGVQEAEFEQNGMQMVRTFANRSAVTADLLKDAARRPADITFDREYKLDLGDVRVRFLTVGPAHTRGDTGFFVDGDGVLFSGDVVMNESFLAANDASSMAAWLKAFDTFDALKPSTIVPSHGAIGPGSLIAANRAVMETIRTRATALKAQGKSIDEVVSTIQSEMTAAHPSWPRANGVAAAARSAYEALAQIGLARDLDPLSLPIQQAVADIAYFARRTDLAAEECCRALEMDPRFERSHRLLGDLALDQGQLDAAIGSFSTAVDLTHGSAETLAALARGDAHAGDAREFDRTMDRIATKPYVSPYTMATIRAARVDVDAAVALLQTAFEQGVAALPSASSTTPSTATTS